VHSERDLESGRIVDGSGDFRGDVVETDEQQNRNHPLPRERNLDLTNPFDVVEFFVSVIARLCRASMASFGEIIEQMKDMPVKGTLPSEADVATVREAARGLSTIPNNAPPNRARLLPTQAEIDMIKRALASQDSSKQEGGNSGKERIC
jgi:hypothetical protein